ncbi:MAG: hypothetical protein ABI164_03730 [Acidobacteriaceae bacterium]
MNATNTANRTRLLRGEPGKRRYWSGFSVCLFILLLAVFTWVVHRRVTQYEAMQTGSHHITATKVCLTERPQISVPTVQSTARGTLFFVVFAFASAMLLRDDSGLSPVRRGSPPGLSRTRIRPCLGHFFFLPPPAILIAL